MRRYHDSLIKVLKDPGEAAEYINAALEDGDTEMLLVALRNVAEAHGGMSKLSISPESIGLTVPRNGEKRAIIRKIVIMATPANPMGLPKRSWRNSLSLLVFFRCSVILPYAPTLILGSTYP